MNKTEGIKLIDQLKRAKIKEYTINDFQQFLLTEDDWSKKRSKRERALKRTYIVVYSTFKKRLLARTFYIEEGFCQRKRYSYFTEVERQLAGCHYILVKRLYTVMGSQGFRVWKWQDDRGWMINNAGTYEIYGLYHNWTGETYTYIENFNDWRPFLKKSIHKYSAYELIPEKEKNNNYMFEYLLKYDKHPQIEMLVKLGMFHILKDDLRYIRWSKKGVEMLGITKQEVKYIQAGITIPDYRKVRDNVIKHHLTIDECKKAIELYSFNITDYKQIRYVTQNDIIGSDYRDYIEFLNQLGVPSQPRYLFPKKFKEAHDQMMKEVETHKNEIIDNGIANFAKELEKISYEDGGLMIVPAHSQAELINESKVLDHCVRTYDKRMAKRETAIFFIRKSNCKETPYVTLELKNKKVIQCRGYKNNIKDPLDENVKLFVNDWCKKNNFKTCFN